MCFCSAEAHTEKKACTNHVPTDDTWRALLCVLHALVMGV